MPEKRLADRACTELVERLRDAKPQAACAGTQAPDYFFPPIAAASA